MSRADEWKQIAEEGVNAVGSFRAARALWKASGDEKKSMLVAAKDFINEFNIVLPPRLGLAFQAEVQHTQQ